MQHRHPASIALALGACIATAAMAADPACRASSSTAAPTVVELYTSEGCSSCPPADKWLSTLKGRSDVLPLAFHVNYWDKLGWADRYATAETTRRQWQLAEWAGSRQVVTPQIVVDGRDADGRLRLPAPGAAAASPVALTLQRDGDAVTASIGASASGPARLDGYWAVLEDGHQSKVRAGENAGATLQHDHVVRLYQPVAAWPAAAGNSSTLNVGKGVAANPRRVAFVVTDAATHKPVQALALGC